MDTPKIAVLLAAYNGVAWLGEQLESIKNQSNVDIHLFISVDKSSDNTEDFVDQWVTSESWITVLPHGHHFGSAAKNFFNLLTNVSFENFDYISFSDQDDIWLSGKLERAHYKLVEIGADAYSSNVTAFWPGGKSFLINKSQPQKKWDYLFEAAGPGCTYLLTKKLALHIQSFLFKYQNEVNGIWLHDWFCYAFARANNYKWFIDENSLVMYRQHGTNQVGANFGWKSTLSRAKKVLSAEWFAQTKLFVRLFKLESHLFVRRYIIRTNRIDRIALAFHSRSCRRRMRDQILFSLAFLILAIVNR